MKKPVVSVIFPLKEHHVRMLRDAAPEAEFRLEPLAQLSDPELAEITCLCGNPPASLLPKLTGLKLLQLNSAGVNSCYLAPGALPEGAELCNASGAYGPGIAEHMLGMLLALTKKLHLYRDSQRLSDWTDHGEVVSIQSSRTLVVGLGDIGSEFGKRMAMLGSRVTGIRRTNAAKPDWLDSQYTLSDLDRLLPEADFVFFALPETAATTGLMNRERIGRMKKGAFLLNAGRGTVLDTEALCDAVESGSLGGAGLDVTDPEPLPSGHRMWQIPNILLTPHVSGGFHLPETHDRIVQICAQNLRACLDGQPLCHIVNRKEGY